MTSGGILETVARQARVATEAAHRPWPLPEQPWLQAQTRHDVLLAHWPVALDALARVLPPELAVDAFDGRAWAGVAAYRVSGLRVRGLPPLPGLSSFPQLEVFACVTAGGRPGTWVFSLELPKQVLVEAAQRVHRLPAYRARILAARGLVDAERDGLAFQARYGVRGEAVAPVPGTLEHFLTERFALYTADGGRIYRAETNHPPWLLQAADASVEAATLVPVQLEGPPLALYAAEQDLVVWPLEELG